MSENSALLQITDLMVFYENALAIKNLSLKCSQGLISGAFGSNSAGKTTLMLAISGIIAYYQKQEKMKGGERITWHGEISFDGDQIINLEPSKRAKLGIILCPERRRIFAESSTLENLKIGGYQATKKQSKKTMHYVFNIFPELDRLKNRGGGFLSGGEQQMLAIGRALMAQPRLLLLDEPLLGLAPLVEKRLAKAVKEINEELGLTMLISEQYAKPIVPVVDYCYVLENGGIIFEGTKDDFKKNPDVMDAYFGGM
ncbi:ABC transporter ATP-binding protein [Desulfatiglans anilini]|uniref:ABC transporter ATP-binding protein n=1 Tax=Desulfatiglans anilini TaxID=90728 RepID=UPI001ABF91C6|nr:ATP-binding cassette domain-containing protein [Desulfatiglans anilini]